MEFVSYLFSSFKRYALIFAGFVIAFPVAGLIGSFGGAEGGMFMIDCNPACVIFSLFFLVTGILIISYGIIKID